MRQMQRDTEKKAPNGYRRKRWVDARGVGDRVKGFGRGGPNPTDFIGGKWGRIQTNVEKFRGRGKLVVSHAWKDKRGGGGMLGQPEKQILPGGESREPLPTKQPAKTVEWGGGRTVFGGGSRTEGVTLTVGVRGLVFPSYRVLALGELSGWRQNEGSHHWQGCMEWGMGALGAVTHLGWGIGGNKKNVCAVRDR